MNGDGSLFYPNGKLYYKGAWIDDNFSGFGELYNDTPETFS